MHPRASEAVAANTEELRDKALNLRESVNSSRARMAAQREQLARLRDEISALRALAGEKPAVRPVPVPAPAFVPPLVKEPARVSAPMAASLRTDGFRLRKHGPYALLLAAAVAIQLRPAPHASAGVPPTAADPVLPKAIPMQSALVAPEDEGAAVALLLVNEWRLPGDERTLSERLGSPAAELPGTRPAWTAERTGERSYRVRFQTGEDAPAYDFDVDLETRRVDPTPDTAALIAPHLTARR